MLQTAKLVFALILHIVNATTAIKGAQDEAHGSWPSNNQSGSAYQCFIIIAFSSQFLEVLACLWRVIYIQLNDKGPHGSLDLYLRGTNMSHAGQTTLLEQVNFKPVPSGTLQQTERHLPDYFAANFVHT